VSGKRHAQTREGNTVTLALHICAIVPWTLFKKPAKGVQTMLILTGPIVSPCAPANTPAEQVETSNRIVTYMYGSVLLARISADKPR
jgi:hypothetical protein